MELNPTTSMLSKRPISGQEQHSIIVIHQIQADSEADDSKLYNMVMEINQIQTQWKAIKFDLRPSGHTNVITNYSEIHQLADGHLMMLSQMIKNDWAKPFQARTGQWINKLTLVSDVLDEMEKCQRSWLMLDPLLECHSVNSSLFELRQVFDCVDATWKNVMNDFSKGSFVLGKCCKSGILDLFKKANNQLNQIMKKLQMTLDRIRTKFPRFYLLSNDQVLNILSQSNDPRVLQHQFKNIFENIEEVKFDENLRITSMKSAQGQLKLLEPVETKGIAVEEWLGELEKMMRASVKEAIFNAIQDCPKTTQHMLDKHCGQAIIASSEIIWTGDVERALKEGGDKLDRHSQKMKQYWKSLIELTRAKLSPQKRKILESLIIGEIHSKGVVEQLCQKKIRSPEEFDWQFQMRHYWKSGHEIECMQTKLTSGYEFLGTVDKLYITPLTQKCYVTLMTAMKLCMGGSPFGPAGTGKTQTVRDLSRSLGQLCYVINCSDQLDYISMGKIFKGIVSSGSWVCFDEFNRICIEVLSVVAQQIRSVFNEKANSNSMMHFEGSDIKINTNFGIFITMNPGYAGRTQLPDNLKDIFRPIGMMIPDYTLICQGALNLHGFVQSADFANKITTFFSLASQQLSRQDHYDFGMRAIISVVNTISKLKEQQCETEDKQLLLKALRDVVLPKIVKEDRSIFYDIIMDLFPGVELPEYNNIMLRKGISQVAKDENLEETPAFIEKILQLDNTIKIRHANMLIGPAASGKSTTIRTLAKILSNLPGESKVNIHTLNPKAVACEELYGYYDQNNEWKDGVITKIMKKCVQDQLKERHWIVCDGPIDANWIEALNTLFDDNKKLCLANGEIIPLSSRITFFLEVEDVCCVSPATISRCGIIYIESQMLNEDVHFESWYRTLPQNIISNVTIMKKLRYLKNIFVLPILKELRQSLHEDVKTINYNITKSLMNILDTYLKISIHAEQFECLNDDCSELEDQLENIYIFAVVWSLCCTTDLKGREKMNCIVRTIINDNLTQINFPKKGSIYDYRYSLEDQAFFLWQEPNKTKIDHSLLYNEVLIKTAESNRSIYFIKMLINNGKHTLSCGPAGIGKSSNIREFLTNELGTGYQVISLPFTSQTKCSKIRDNIMNKFDKQNKKCVVFVDDMNVPKLEVYGARPPNQLIRQIIDQKGMYNKQYSWVNLERITVLASMETQRNIRPVTNRLVRHFNVMTDNEFGRDTMTNIFTQLLAHFHADFSLSVQNIQSQLVEAGISVYEDVRNSFKSTNINPHYNFHFRDIWKVFKGVCEASSQNVVWAKDVLKLWYNQNMRIYHDRLSSEKDRFVFKNLLQARFPELGYEKEEIINQDRTVFGKIDNVYREINDFQELTHTVEEAQAGTTTKIDLVLFDEAVEHISRIARAISQPRGNALVLGTECVGRTSISRIAASLSKITIVEIESNSSYNFEHWRKDLKSAMMKVGLEGLELCFLLADTHPKIIEDVNDILNGEQFIDLYSQKQLQLILSFHNSFENYLDLIRNNLHIVLTMNPYNSSFAVNIRNYPSLTKCCTINWINEWPEEAYTKVAEAKLKDINVGEIDSLVKVFKNIHKKAEKISRQYQQQTGLNITVNQTSYYEFLNTYRNLITSSKEQEQAIVESQNISNINYQQKALKIKQIAEDKNSKVCNLTSEVLIEFEKCHQDIQSLNKSDLVQLKAFIAPPEAVKDVLTGLWILFEDQMKRNGCKVVFFGSKEYPSSPKTVDYYATCKKHLLNSNFLSNLLTFDKNNISEKTLEKLKKQILDKPSMTFESVKKVSKAASVLLRWIKGIYVFGSVAHKTEQQKVSKEAQHARSEIIREPQVKEEQNGVEEYDQIDELESRKSIALTEINNSFRSITSISKNALIELKALVNPPSCVVMAMKALVILFEDHLKKNNCETIFLSQKDRSKGAKKHIDYNGMFRKYLINDISKFITMLRLMNPDDISEKTLTSLTDIIKKPEFDYNTAMKASRVTAELVRWIMSIHDYCMVKQFETSQEKQLELKQKNTRIHKIQRRNDSQPDGDYIIAAAIITYGGALTTRYRSKLYYDSQRILRDNGSIVSKDFRLKQFFDNEGLIKTWISQNALPSDEYSIENAVIIRYTQRISILIDPQGLGSQFIKKLGKKTHPLGLKTIRSSQRDAMQIIEICAEAGKWVVFQAPSQYLPSFISNLENSHLSFNSSFRLFIKVNKLSSEMKSGSYTNFSIINFSLTHEIIEQQLLPQINKILQEQKIQLQSRKSRAIATRASLLYFCLEDIAVIEPMYTYSLDWFKSEFLMKVLKSVTQATKTSQEIIYQVTIFFKQFFEGSIFAKHKLLFNFLLTIKITYGPMALSKDELDFLIRNHEKQQIKINPTTWISTQEWARLSQNICALSKLDNFEGFEDYFITNLDKFRKILESNNPHKEILPSYWQHQLNIFQKILLIKSLRPDKVITALKDWISEQMEAGFTKENYLSITDKHQFFDNRNPIIFINSHCAYPVPEILKIDPESSQKASIITLGQGKDHIAEKAIIQGSSNGNWVILQDCHLYPSWFSRLEMIIDTIRNRTNIHENYRLWITSMPSEKFPTSILQNSFKIAFEQPQGMKSIMLKLYNTLTEEDFSSCTKSTQYRKILFAICNFHAHIITRNKYGSNGWNCHYDWSEADFYASKVLLKTYLNQKDSISYETIRYLIGQTIYGGRIRDDKDYRLIRNIAEKYLNPEVMRDGYKFSRSGLYYSLPAGNVDNYINYLQSLPNSTTPEVFQLSDNTEIIRSEKQLMDLIVSLRAIHKNRAVQHQLQETHKINKIIKFVEQTLPPVWNIKEIKLKFPVSYNQSLNSFLTKEIQFFNILLTTVQDKITKMKNFLNNQIYKDQQIIEMCQQLLEKRIPESWRRFSFLTNKSLYSWLKQINQRYQFFNTWINQGLPCSFWLGAFFFPQGFLTAIKQNYARKYMVSTSNLCFDVKIIDDKSEFDIKELSEDGVFVYGLTLEGARWDSEQQQLKPQLPIQCTSELPMLCLTPRELTVKRSKDVYRCPLYKLAERKGVLSTTGISTNFVTYFDLPSKQSESTWIKKGVAAFLTTRI